LRAQITRHPLAAVLAGGLVLRLLLAALPGFPDDLQYFRRWGETIASGGPEDFYASKGLHNYPPGYMHVLWLLGDLDETFGFDRSQWDYLLKLPSILADLGSAYVLYLLLAGQTAGERLGAAAL
jgi:dolichyl-phosphate-mannose-protein mannosyltransferase